MKKFLMLACAIGFLIAPITAYTLELDQKIVGSNVMLIVSDFDTTATIAKADLERMFTGGSVISLVLHYDTEQTPTVSLSIVRKGKTMVMYSNEFTVAAKTFLSVLTPEVSVINFAEDRLIIESTGTGTALLTVVISKG